MNNIHQHIYHEHKYITCISSEPFEPKRIMIYFHLQVQLSCTRPGTSCTLSPVRLARAGTLARAACPVLRLALARARRHALLLGGPRARVSFPRKQLSGRSFGAHDAHARRDAKPQPSSLPRLRPSPHFLAHPRPACQELV
jgi:hypothetical protein